MSITSIEPANQICYIEKPPKPLGSAVNDFVKERIKPEETGIPRRDPSVVDKSATAGSIVNASSSPATAVNHIGQITGQLINTSA